MKTQKKTYLFALAPFLLLCLLFEIIPVIYTVVRSFFPEGGDIVSLLIGRMAAGMKAV